jgi:TonB family protein
MTSIRVRHTLRLLCCLGFFSSHALGAAGQGVADIEASAKKGNFQQAFVQSRAALAVAPSLDGIKQVRAAFARFPQIQAAGVSRISSLIDTARTERDLLSAQSELRYFVKLVNLVICDPSPLAALQTRFVAAASRLIIEAGIPVTFESNLVVDWAASTGSDLDRTLERRIYQNTLANIAARDPRDTPSVLMADRLFRYLLRDPEAREEALPTLEKVQWRWSDLDGPLREVYPELAKQWGEPGLPEASAPFQSEPGVFGSAVNFDTKGVEFGPWVRRVLAQIKKNWLIPNAAMALRGRVAVSFNVHKDGTITDIVVSVPCAFDVLNKSSSDAVAASSPTVPLPPEYPSEKALITITFYYNVTPGQM